MEKIYDEFIEVFQKGGFNLTSFIERSAKLCEEGKEDEVYNNIYYMTNKLNYSLEKYSDGGFVLLALMDCASYGVKMHNFTEGKLIDFFKSIKVFYLKNHPERNDEEVQTYDQMTIPERNSMIEFHKFVISFCASMDMSW